LIGHTLGHFRIDSKLGEGGMGVVYRATDNTLRREVALKVLPESLAADPERRRRFLREARAAAAVTHANIATVYEIGESDGHVFIAMELVKGATLRARMAPGLDHTEALRIAREIARGLARAHEGGIVHRDLKPENVMITDTGDVKILDFGLAKVVDRGPPSPVEETASQITAEGRVLGTPPYMSPEQVEGRSEVDVRTDVFSFGAMLYEMVSGVLPFEGTTSIAVLYAVLHKEPEPLYVVCPDAPQWAVRVVTRCLRKPREERFPSGSELFAALETEREGLSTPSHAPSASAAPPAKVVTVFGMGTALGATIASDSVARVVTVPPATGRAAKLWIATAIALVAAGALATSAVWGRTTAGAPPASMSAPTIAAPQPTTLPDLPLPTSAVPEAITDYRAGLQVLRDDNFTKAVAHFERAAELDPTMAVAHLRFVVAGFNMSPRAKVRAAHEKASELRAQLSERDRVLLDAIEPVAGRGEPDQVELLARLEKARARYPFDEEFASLVARVSAEDPSRGVSSARRAVELDPLDACAWESLGRSLALQGEVLEGRAALERCATVSSESTDCYLWLAFLDGAAGRCADMERDTRRQADHDPGPGNFNLAVAAVALDRPAVVVREALARHQDQEAADARSTEEGLNDASFAMVSGQFDLALRRLEGILRGGSVKHADSSGAPWLQARRIQLLEEMGSDTEARTLARQLVDQTRGSSPDVGFTKRLSVWWVMRIAGEPLDPRRREWVAEQLRLSPRSPLTWALAWALPVTNKEEANEALRALAADEGLALPRGGESMAGLIVELDGAAGHVLLLAGKPKEALPHLERTTNDCFILASPLEHVHAPLDLGAAREQTLDVAGACEAYGKIVARWGHATPRSVTAEAAREAMTRLGCLVKRE